MCRVCIMTDADITPEEVQSHIDNGTLFNFLMGYIIVTPHKSEDTRFKLESDFPDWLFQYVQEESREKIIALVREGAKRVCEESS